MADITRSGAARKPPRSPLPDRLDDIADRVARLGRGARDDPERFVTEKLSISAELRRLAREARP